MIRRVTIMDIPDCIAIARACYPPFDEAEAREWGTKAMLDKSTAFFRDDDAWGCCAISKLFYEAKPRCAMLFLAVRRGAVWQACKVVKAMVAWSKSKGASGFHFGEETGMDLSPIAKRVGAKLDRPSYKVDFSWGTSKAGLVRFWRSEAPSPETRNSPSSAEQGAERSRAA
jgi:hypothetical protein